MLNACSIWDKSHFGPNMQDPLAVILSVTQGYSSPYTTSSATHYSARQSSALEDVLKTHLQDNQRLNFFIKWNDLYYIICKWYSCFILCRTKINGRHGNGFKNWNRYRVNRTIELAFVTFTGIKFHRIGLSHEADLSPKLGHLDRRWHMEMNITACAKTGMRDEWEYVMKCYVTNLYIAYKLQCNVISHDFFSTYESFFSPLNSLECCLWRDLGWSA